MSSLGNKKYWKVKEEEEVRRVLPGVVDQLLQALVLHLQLANISVHHVEPLPGDPDMTV